MWFDIGVDILFFVLLAAGSIALLRKWRRERRFSRFWPVVLYAAMAVFYCKTTLDDADRIWRAKLAGRFAESVVAELRDGRMPPLSSGMYHGFREQVESYVGRQFPSQYTLENCYVLDEHASVSVVFTNGEKLSVDAEDQRDNKYWQLPFSHPPDYAVRYLFLTSGNS